jgi:hypothetical protein
MTPGVALTDLHVIYFNGILGEGGLLKSLGITETFDHKSLLTDDIVTWPKNLERLANFRRNSFAQALLCLM